MDEEFAEFIKTNEIKFKYAKGMRDIIGNEIHPYHEIFFFIGGEADFISESGTEKLLPFTTVIIPKETFHCFVVSGNEKDYCRCVLNFDSVAELDTKIEKKFSKILLTSEENIAEIFMKLKKLVTASFPQLEKDILLKSLFAQILVCIKDQTHHYLKSDMNPITVNIMKYINNNLHKHFTITTLANEFHISESHLAHVFKNDLHISIHKYILEKRLILANKRIRNSEHPTQVASECGFRDYSGFYKQYKKMFGISPSKSLPKK